MPATPTTRGNGNRLRKADLGGVKSAGPDSAAANCPGVPGTVLVTVTTSSWGAGEATTPCRQSTASTGASPKAFSRRVALLRRPRSTAPPMRTAIR